MGTLRHNKEDYGSHTLEVWHGQVRVHNVHGPLLVQDQSVSRTSWMGLCEQNTVAHGQMLMNQLPGKMFPHDGTFRNEQCAARGYTVQVANPVINGVHVTQVSWFAKP